MDLIHPRKKVNCYGRPVYAPNNAEEILENWKGGEYDQDKLAYPLRPITQSEKEIIDAYSMKLAAQGYSTFKQ